MKLQLLGDAMREQRVALGLTQEQICEGICDPATMSRIENNTRVPTHSVMNALLGRLSMPGSRYYALLSEYELELENAVGDLNTCVIRHSHAAEEDKGALWVQAMEQLHRLEALAQPDDRITRQCILAYRALLGREDGPYSFAERLSMQMEALRLTVPRFEVDKIEKFRYNMDESRIINQIAGTYSRNGNHRKALSIYGRLLDYIKKNVHHLPEYTGQLAMVTYNYACELGECKYYAKAIRVAEEGKTVCVERTHYQFLPGFLAILAECYYLTGHEEKSKELYVYAHYLYKLLGDEYSLRYIEPDFQKRFHIDFPV